MRTSRRALAVLCLILFAGVLGAVVASGLPVSSSGAMASSGSSSLQRAVNALARSDGATAAISGVLVTPGRAPVLQRTRGRDPRAFPLSWVNPLGDTQAVEVVRSWTTPQVFTPTRVLLGRRNGRGRLAWRVEGRRRGHAEVWLLAPNGTLLSHRRL